MKTFRSLTATVTCASIALGLPLAASATPDPNAPPELISTFAGDGTSALVNGPHSVVEAPGGGFLIVDTLNNRIRKVDAGGAMTTVVGTGVGAFNSDGLPATQTKLFEPRGIAVTGDGGLLIADTENQRVRKVAPGFGAVTTVAGTGTEGGLLGSLLNGLLGTATELDHPSAVAAMADGGFLIADTENNVIRKVDALGTMTTVAGDGSGGYSGDGGAAAAAQLCNPEDVELTDDGGFLIADTGNNVIRKVSAAGTITTVAGNGTAGYSGDYADPTLAQLNAPAGVEAKSNGAFLIADTANNVVRKVKYGEIKTEAGDGSDGFQGDGGDPESASLSGPKDVLESGDAELIADTGNNRIRLVGSLTAPDNQGGVLEQAVPGDSSGPGPALPAVEPPKVGQHMQVEHIGGTVTVKLPNTGQYIALEHGASIPMGSVVDATRGSVTITSAKDARGATQSATFHDGAFKVQQKRAAKPVTDLIMRGGDFRPCWRARSGASNAGRALISRSRRVRRLWGSGHGRFRTKGRHGAATVRGTIWLTEDSCAGTRVTVRRGLVAVRDFNRKRTVMVPKGHSYLSRSHPPRKRAR
jgi:hypothetical protein